MIESYWVALRIGHRVDVHDDDDPRFRLSPGVVTDIDLTSRGADVAIRIDVDGVSRVVRPRRHATHLTGAIPSAECWRCRAGS